MKVPEIGLRDELVMLAVVLLATGIVYLALTYRLARQAPVTISTNGHQPNGVAEEAKIITKQASEELGLA